MNLKDNYTTKEHGDLVDTHMAGNGYHGRCEICGKPLVTDLGYTSWEKTKCKERVVTDLYDFPKDVISYVKFRGLKMRWAGGITLFKTIMNSLRKL